MTTLRLRRQSQPPAESDVELAPPPGTQYVPGEEVTEGETLYYYPAVILRPDQLDLIAARVVERLKGLA